MIKIVFIFLVVVISHISYACSPVQTRTPFVITGEKSPNPVTPTFKVTSILRGQRGSFGSCADTGQLILSLKETPKYEQGYLFEIVDGKFEEKEIFQGMVKAFRNDITDFYFAWFDGNSNKQEPINIKVKITAVSLSGVKSKPQFLQIVHKGVKVPWWNIWKKLPYSSFTEMIEG